MQVERIHLQCLRVKRSCELPRLHRFGDDRAQHGLGGSRRRVPRGADRGHGPARDVRRIRRHPGAAGASMLFGDYNIDVETPGLSNILIHYQSHSPIIARADGEVSFNCDLTQPQWGLGGGSRGRAPQWVDPQRHYLPDLPAEYLSEAASGKRSWSAGWVRGCRSRPASLRSVPSANALFNRAFQFVYGFRLGRNRWIDLNPFPLVFAPSGRVNAPWRPPRTVSRLLAPFRRAKVSSAGCQEKHGLLTKARMAFWTRHHRSRSSCSMTGVLTHQSGKPSSSIRLSLIP